LVIYRSTIFFSKAGVLLPTPPHISSWPDLGERMVSMAYRGVSASRRLRSSRDARRSSRSFLRVITSDSPVCGRDADLASAIASRSAKTARRRRGFSLSSAQRPPSGETLGAIMVMSSFHYYLGHVECVDTLVRLLLCAVNRIDETRNSASCKLLAPASRVTESSASPRGSC
jgi:hypothetical protein